MRVTLAAMTYQRNRDLEELLPLLLLQLESVTANVDLLIVDNDPAGSARAVVDSHSSNLVRYEHEPTAGIAAARNRALDVTTGSRLLVFIDDDERPSVRWLELLLREFETANSSDPAVAAVAGPVVSRYSEKLDPWIHAGRFFERRRYPSGTRVPAAATNNLLLDVRAVRSSGVRFREEFGLSGGSDTMFTRELVASGLAISWCDEAVVVDVVPGARMSRAWVLQRAFRSANSWSRSEIALSESLHARVIARARLTWSGLARIVLGSMMSGCGKVLGRATLSARGARAMHRGRGLILGAWGVVYVEYARAEHDSASH